MPLVKQIKTGRYSFPSKHWSSVTSDAKDLIRKLLTVNPQDRISLKDALQHPWFQDPKLIRRAQAKMYPNGIPSTSLSPTDRKRKHSPSPLDKEETDNATKIVPYLKRLRIDGETHPA